MSTINAEDSLYYRNQPYGLWKAGNPLIKYMCIALLLWGAFALDPLIIIKGSIISFIMLYMPSRPKSILLNLVTNFGIGSLFIFLFSKYYITIKTLQLQSNIPYIYNIDWIIIFAYMLLIYVFYRIRRAMTSRDLAWLIDIFPRKMRSPFGGMAYSYVYGLFRFDGILEKVTQRILSRGGCRLLSRRTCGKLNLIEIIGIRCLNLMRYIDEMSLTVEYILQSRIKIIDRSNPSKRAWSSVDFSIAGLIILSVLLPKFMNM